MKNQLLCLLLSLAGLPALAAGQAYVLSAQLHADRILATPPAGDAETARAELAELHRIEAGRTPAQVARAQADEHDETLFVFRDALGDGFTAAALPQTAVLSAHVKQQEDRGQHAAQERLPARAALQPGPDLTPGLQDQDQERFLPERTRAGRLPGRADPGQPGAGKARRDPRARQGVAHNRLVCGVHYASDVQASRLLAYATHAAMLETRSTARRKPRRASNCARRSAYSTEAGRACRLRHPAARQTSLISICNATSSVV